MAEFNRYDKLKGKPFKFIDNYIYIHNLGKFLILPTFPDSIQDGMSANFNQTTPLGRSAPIYAYQHSGPRSLTITLTLHRDMMNSINTDVSNIKLDDLGNEDYIDILTNYIQSLAVPVYNSEEKIIDSPYVSIRFGDEIFITGVVSGGVTVSKSGPILTDSRNPKGKYAIIGLTFTVNEITPYDASTIARLGSFRGFNSELEQENFKK